MNRVFNVLIITLIIIFFVLSGLLPVRAEDDDLSKAEEELRLGHLFDYYMTESFVMLRDDSLLEKIAEVVDQIVHVTEKADNKVRLRIINDQLPIVSSVPGYVYVSTGMLDILENEAELASIIAHAFAHAIEKDHYQTYVDAVWNDRVTNFTGHIMPLLVFSGLGGVAIAGGGVAAASAATFEGILFIESGLYSTTLLTQSLTASDLHERGIFHNMLLPHIYLPETKTSLTVMIFLSDVYRGYGKKDEIQADNLAINYLHEAGYNPAAMVSVLNKLNILRSDYIRKGYISHLLVAKPGLEKRIDNANSIIENYK